MRTHLSGSELLSSLAGVDGVEIEAVDLFDLPSTHLGFSEMRAIAQAARSALDDGADAVVVTHGTDTLEETAYFVDLVCEPGPPIMFTAAMLPPPAPIDMISIVGWSTGRPLTWVSLFFKGRP